MGFRSAIKKGGGFLANVDGTFKDYEFTARFKGEKKDGEWLYFVPSILVDGADEPVDQHMFIGAAENYEIEDDGKTLTMADGSSVSFGFSTPFGRFMDSLLEKGFPEEELPNLEDGEPLTLEALIDRRFRFKQEVDEKANEKFGKRKGTGKNAKKEYDRTNTVIDAVLGEKTTAGKPNGKPAKGKGPSEDDLKDEAAAVLKDIIEGSKVPVLKKNLPVLAAKAVVKNPNRDALRAIILDEDWQEEQDWLEADRKGVLSVAA